MQENASVKNKYEGTGNREKRYKVTTHITNRNTAVQCFSTVCRCAQRKTTLLQMFLSLSMHLVTIYLLILPRCIRVNKLQI